VLSCVSSHDHAYMAATALLHVHTNEQALPEIVARYSRVNTLVLRYAGGEEYAPASNIPPRALSVKRLVVCRGGEWGYCDPLHTVTTVDFTRLPIQHVHTVELRCSCLVINLPGSVRELHMAREMAQGSGFLEYGGSECGLLSRAELSKPRRRDGPRSVTSLVLYDPSSTRISPSAFSIDDIRWPSVTHIHWPRVDPEYKMNSIRADRFPALPPQAKPPPIPPSPYSFASIWPWPRRKNFRGYTSPRCQLPAVLYVRLSRKGLQVPILIKPQAVFVLYLCELTHAGLLAGDCDYDFRFMSLTMCLRYNSLFGMTDDPLMVKLQIMYCEGKQLDSFPATVHMVFQEHKATCKPLQDTVSRGSRNQAYCWRSQLREETRVIKSRFRRGERVEPQRTLRSNCERR
jgi:hypothetical protein